MPDYIPRPDAEFDNYQATFISYASANMSALGLLTGNITSLTTAQTTWNSAFAAHIAAVAAARSAREAKDDAKAALVGVIRQMAMKVQGQTTVTDAQRQALGITVADTVATPSPAPTTRPVVTADTSQRLQVTLSWSDESTPDTRSKPAGVLGAEIYVKVDGAPPTDLDDCEFLSVDTKSPYVATFDGADANKIAHFMVRWLSTRGERGPVSETVSATITG
jgi:hypothetical protein